MKSKKGDEDYVHNDNGNNDENDYDIKNIKNSIKACMHRRTDKWSSMFIMIMVMIMVIMMTVIMIKVCMHRRTDKSTSIDTEDLLSKE